MKTRTLLVCGILLVAWAVFGGLVVPRLITDAYHGQSFGLLNALIDGQDVEPVGHYHAKWWRVFAGSLIALAGFFLLATVGFSRPSVKASSGQPSEIV